ncbi:uncharacterized protein LOC123533418 [Mercenaria mercenaria]|uniref:uncharacterized protein LOC123533418 n=1 Tax=Mercenaria mercenaria TaxID=6596 RepID=UPI00234F44DD|nr:uncharacterized protein LOC123533418 [Mercenaria mercenaria]
MAFLQELSISSTFPFLWDDPTKESDVKQVAIDLGNAAFRGKYKDGAKTPQTGCLVTANFSLTEVEKYYSRICLLPFGKPDMVHCGDGPRLEAKASAASAAFPTLLGIAARLNRSSIREEVANLNKHQDLNLRIQEGIAVPAYIAKQVLTECGLPTDVVDQTCETVVGYHGRKSGVGPTIGNTDLDIATNLQKALEESRTKTQIGSVIRIHDWKLHIPVRDLEMITGVHLRDELKARGVATCGKSFRFLVEPGVSKIFKCAMLRIDSLSNSKRKALDEWIKSAEKECSKTFKIEFNIPMKDKCDTNCEEMVVDFEHIDESIRHRYEQYLQDKFCTKEAYSLVFLIPKTCKTLATVTVVIKMS